MIHYTPTITTNRGVFRCLFVYRYLFTHIRIIYHPLHISLTTYSRIVAHQRFDHANLTFPHTCFEYLLFCHFYFHAPYFPLFITLLFAFLCF